MEAFRIESIQPKPPISWYPSTPMPRAMPTRKSASSKRRATRRANFARLSSGRFRGSYIRSSRSRVFLENRFYLNFDSGSRLARFTFELPDLIRSNWIWVYPINLLIFAECFAFFSGRVERFGSLQMGLGLVL